MEPFYLCNTELLGLSNSTAIVYNFLCKVNNVLTNESHYGKNSIARLCHISTSSVVRALRTLCQKGLLEIRHRFDERGRQTSNYYILIENPQLKLSPCDAISPQPNSIPSDTKEKKRTSANPRLFPCRLNLFQHRLTACEIKVYSYLTLRAGRDGKCMPSKKEIASDCGISVSSVWRAVKALSNAGLLIVYHQTRKEAFGNNGTSVNLYLLNGAHTEAQEQPEATVQTDSDGLSSSQAPTASAQSSFPVIFKKDLFDSTALKTPFLRIGDTLPHFISDTPRTKSRKKATVNLRDIKPLSKLAMWYHRTVSKLAGFKSHPAKLE
ncbi:hypothetical protein A7X67_10990 [Clostridium sp. W14A]|nr:hypothetical protein A7X67_10990 [Clostridium sp. W14A]